MGNATSGASDSAFDLFDRWLAHHEGQPTPDVDEELPVDVVEDPLFDESFVAPHSEQLALEPENVPTLAQPPEPEPEPEPEDPARSVFDLFNAAPEPDDTAAVPPAAVAAPEIVPETVPEVAPEAIPAVVAEDARTTMAAEAIPEPTPEPVAAPHAEVIPGVVEFVPRSGTHRLVGLLLLVCLAATGVAGYVAQQDRTPVVMGIAGVLGLLTLVVWAVRAGSATAHLTVRGGQLEIVRGGSRNMFDLASHYTPIDVIGEPGDRGWKVLFHRRSMSPFVVDASMVDPAEFTRVVRHYRPERD